MQKEDSLDGDVYNIDVFQVLLKYEISRSTRYPNPLTLIQLEIKPTALNTESLKAAPLVFASALNRHLRASDIPARNGNMFTILLPNSDKHGARTVCERLLSVFRNKFEDKEGNSLAFSLQMGVTYHSGGKDLTSSLLLQKANEGLVQSQRKGPNTYVMVE
jgi:two-component system cell cycle response regulator